jgi:hypothetical protein
MYTPTLSIRARARRRRRRWLGIDTAAAVITGTHDQVWGSGWWMNWYRLKPLTWFTTATLVCYLEIVRHMSAVFDEARAPLDTGVTPSTSCSERQMKRH